VEHVVENALFQIYSVRISLTCVSFASYSFRWFQEEKYHTRLAVQYLDRVVQLKEHGAPSEEMEPARTALRSFLEKSIFYRAQFLLPRVRDAGLQEETAIMHGKVRILFHAFSVQKGTGFLILIRVADWRP